MSASLGQNLIIIFSRSSWKWINPTIVPTVCLSPEMSLVLRTQQLINVLLLHVVCSGLGGRLPLLWVTLGNSRSHVAVLIAAIEALLDPSVVSVLGLHRLRFFITPQIFFITLCAVDIGSTKVVDIYFLKPHFFETQSWTTTYSCLGRQRHLCIFFSAPKPEPLTRW